MPLVGGHRYLASTAVFLNEVLKLGISLTVALYEISGAASPTVPATSLFGTLVAAVFTGDSWKLAIPATLYTLQNTLQYVAVSNLEAATLQVTYQFKILPTAVFSVVLLRRSLPPRKWAALALLMFGVAIVQLPVASSDHLPALPEGHPYAWFPRSLSELGRGGGAAEERGLDKRSATYEGIERDYYLQNPPQNPLLGLCAALSACVTSALASVYFEKILKESTFPVSVWIRNVQLSMYSLFPALFIGVVFVDGEEIAKSGFFAGYNAVVWTTVALQAVGGIVVALCVHYADTILKSFATSISILISLLASIAFFDFSLTRNFLVGTAVVIYATYLYTGDERARLPPLAPQPPPPIRIHDFEKMPTEITIKLPTTPLIASEGASTSRPGSPALHHQRPGSSRGYFGSKDRDE